MGRERYVVDAVVLEGRSPTELARRHGISRSWLYRLLRRYPERGSQPPRVLPPPHPHTRPRSSFIGFEAALPNELWQADTTHWRLADGTDVEILNLIDDHSPLPPPPHAL